jgi:hypothetical protein
LFGLVVVLCFFDAFDRAYRHTLRRIEVTNAFHAGVGINYVDGAALCDGVGGAFGFASAARNARVVNFHCHE